ncbi:hypothetical protein Pint_02740 [Pistacia integerrima]|uniref:Uncharacterized protein n=1 Tax=Pistacia integerrima TaxID=434235 RepID=A0ACC0ZKP1_9ROSI|nr:hypothetical protein Pint_02740 [Pistacia integerrima]
MMRKLEKGSIEKHAPGFSAKDSEDADRLTVIGKELLAAGFNVEMVEYKNINFSVMDVGGQSRAWVSQECNDGQVKTRPLWSIYFRKTPCLIFFIDSNDRERVDDARNELHLTLQKGELSDAVLLVFANKQDLPNAMNTTEITDKLGLNSFGQQRWHIQGTSAISGEGLQEGLDWICTTVLGEGEQAHEQK